MNSITCAKCGKSCEVPSRKTKLCHGCQSASQKNATERKASEKKRKEGASGSIIDIATQAKKNGMSYGQYVARLHEMGV